MKYPFKLLQIGFGVFILGPLASVYTLLSKHWALNSTVSLLALPFSLLPFNPFSAFVAGYFLSALAVAAAQQVYAFTYNKKINQCEMMVAPIVPEISYAALKGLLVANSVTARAESRYQEKNLNEIKQEDIIYGDTSMAILLATGGHFRCAQRKCYPITWDTKEHRERGVEFFL